MNTTALLVDILIIGLQVFIWISFFLFSFVFNPLVALSIFQAAPALVLFFIIIIAYILGIVFDHIISLVFQVFKTKEERKINKRNFTLNLLSLNSEVHKFLDNKYARLRIARATTFNIPLITIASTCFLSINNTDFRMSMHATQLFLLIFGFTLFILSILGWKRRKRIYWDYIREALKNNKQ